MYSVIVPIYYGRKYIKTLINMVEKNAAKVNGEIALLFVVDSLEEDIKDLCKSEKIKIQIIQNKKNQGIHYSRVQGINQANGKYILMLDQDNKISDNFL